jgi:hypothetical protein
MAFDAPNAGKIDRISSGHSPGGRSRRRGNGYLSVVVPF